MNIFYLHEDPKIASTMHIDKHVVKMVIETAQLLSTAHRVLDGKEYYGKTANGRKIKRWKHPNSNLEHTLYKASHVNHPSAVWVRENGFNYRWTWLLMAELGKEFYLRYGKMHMTTEKLEQVLQEPPKSIPWNHVGTQPPQCMPDDVKVPGDSVQAYRNYYVKYKHPFATWRTQKPVWFDEMERNQK
tara:strand:+ start:233 stop:793 length:561 start_codon:yes stop_codon:yes gene_type:complete